MHLEGELNATLLFEHGGRQPTNTLWVAHIRVWVHVPREDSLGLNGESLCQALLEGRHAQPGEDPGLGRPC